MGNYVYSYKIKGQQKEELFSDRSLHSMRLPMELPDGCQHSLLSGVQHLGNETH